MIVVSTDGSALGNPNGSMGWAWADHSDKVGTVSEHHHTGNADAGGATNGTNQIGELCAVLEALRAHPGSEPLTIETDSQYAINCATTWIHGWKKNGWKNSKKEPVKNADLIRAIDREITEREGAVKFVWVKGHAGNAGNEKVDTLARTYAEDCRSGTKDGYLPLEGWKSLLASEYAEGMDVPSDAKMLLENEISREEYHIGRAVGKDTNPDFSGKNTENKENSQDDIQNETHEIETHENEMHENETREEVGSSTASSDTTNDSTTNGSTVRETTRETDRETTDELTRATNATTREVKYKAVPGLSVSGVLQFTPAPRTSPTFTGEPRFISGSINVSGYVEPDGTLHLSPTAFYINQANK